MQRPQECPRTVWAIICIMGWSYQFWYWASGKQARDQREWDKMHERIKLMSITREHNLYPFNNSEDLQWIMDDEPTRGRDLLEQDRKNGI